MKKKNKTPMDYSLSIFQVSKNEHPDARLW